MAHARSTAFSAVLLLVGLAASPVAARELSFEQRVEAQEAIERVYYGHQLAATESFEATVPRTVLENKVRRYLLQSAALERFWRTPVTAVMLERELQRMAAATRMPERLNELYAALDHDVFLIQECLARPLLVDRLSRNFFAFDGMLHADARARAEQLRADLVSGRVDPRAEHRQRTISTLVREDVAERTLEPDAPPPLSVDEFASLRRLAPDAPGEIGPVVEERDAFTLRFVLDEHPGHARLVTYSVPKRSWDDWWSEAQGDERLASMDVRPVASSSGALPAAVASCVDEAWDYGAMQSDERLTPRSGHTAAWTGSQMIVWGGGRSGALSNNGRRYDPATDTWAPMTTVGAPAARWDHTAVWTGSRMIVWGGKSSSGVSLNSGGRYDPVADQWTPTSVAGAPTPRNNHTAVWTGSRMIVWGGEHGPLEQTGGRYDPATDTWATTTTTGAPSARTRHVAVWTGNVMVIALGGGPGAMQFGGRYDPVADSWTPTASSGTVPYGPEFATAVWTGTRMIVWGGFDNSGETTGRGQQYDPLTNTWTPTSTVGAPASRSIHTAVWTGNRMIVWGGYIPSGWTNSGGSYDPVSDSWTPTSLANAPERRVGHTAVWTGSQMIVWGGMAALNTDYRDTGARYDPTTDTWTPTSLALGPATGRAVWTGNSMIVWDGRAGSRYDPATDGWTQLSQIGAPSPRTDATVVWSGSQMIVWGGADESYTALNHGGRYDPISDTWAPVTITGAPVGRRFHTAVWSGSSMIVWGGDSGAPAYSDLASGGRYDPSSNQWSPTSAAGAPSARSSHTAVWTGSEMIIWGGNGNTGGIYRPSTDTWRSTATSGAPPVRFLHSAVWTGIQMIVWGGANPFDFTVYQDGGRYDPGTDIWTSTTMTGAPQARLRHIAVWSGNEMIVWGGQNSSFSALGTGARYSPAANQWLTMTTIGAPTPRALPASVWTGDSMLVWGGYDDLPLYNGGRYVIGPQIDTDGDGFCDVTDCAPANPRCTSNCTDQDGDGWCVTTDCNDQLPACTSSCTDADGDGFCVTTDCDDQKPHCTSSCTDADGDGFCVTIDCDDQKPHCTTNCADADGDGYCVTTDCNDAQAGCTTSCADADGDGLPACAGDCDDQNPNCGASCTDADGDGLCAGNDCNDAAASCTTNCTDTDGDGFCITHDCNDARPHCTTSCADADGDGFCVGNDCNDASPGCTTSCVDADGDGFCVGNDCNDASPGCTTSCIDADGDGLCAGNDCNDASSGCTTSCVDADGDGLAACAGDCNDQNSHCTVSCADADGDGFCATADCDDGHASCTTSCVDGDGDGLTVCAGDCYDDSAACTTSCVDADGDGLPVCAGDCNDANPHCTTSCADADADGWCILHDCDDSIAACTTSCVDADADGWRPCAGDCNDQSAAAHPGGTEVCSDGLDNDCNGLTDAPDAACNGLAVSGLRFTSHSGLSWDPAAVASAYALYRGTISVAGFRGYDHLCEATELAAPAAEDADAPPTAEGFYYLATGLSIGPSPARAMAAGPLGHTGAGAPIPESSTISCGPRVYVDPAMLTGAHTGLSWADAYTSVNAALRHTGSAGRGLEVWVTGSPGDLATLNGAVRPGGRLLGGFAGNESLPWERSPSTTPTVWQHALSFTPLLRGINADLVVDGMTLRNDFILVLASLAGDRLELTDVRLEQDTVGVSGVYAVELPVTGGGQLYMRDCVLPAPAQGGLHADVTGGTLTGRLYQNRLDGGDDAALRLEARANGTSNAEVRLDIIGNTISGGSNGVVLGAHVVDQARTATQSSYLASNVIHGAAGSLVTVEATGSFTTASGAAAARAVPLLVGNTLSDGGAGVTCSATRSDSTGNPTGHEVRATPELWDNLITFSDGAGIAESADDVAAALVADPVVVGNDLYGNGELYRDEGTTSLGTIAQVNALSGAQDNYAADPLYIDRPAEDYHLSRGVVVAFGSAMRYLANASDPTLGMSWVQPTFDDSSWNSGSYGVGYDAAPPPNAVALLQTVVPAGQASVFSRTTFTIDDVAEVQTLTLGADFDDGYAAWINGVEVFRSASLPPGALAWNTAAAAHESSNSAVPSYEEQDITFVGIPALVEGTNVLAVAVWNDSPASSDLVLVPLLEIDNGSPAVDAGHLAPPRSTRADIDGEARNRDGNGDGVARPDTGADEQ